MMNITKNFVDKLIIPQKLQKGRTEQKRYYDGKLKGFGIRVTSGGAKSFFIEKQINSKLKRITLARYPEITIEQARKEAQKILGKIATGIDPIAEKKSIKSKGITLQHAFDDYLKARKSLKKTTITDYQRVLNQVMSDWKEKRLLDITKDMVCKRHAKHGAENSEARANLAMRLLRSIFNFAAAEYEDERGRSIIYENPVKRLSHTRSWYRIERRQNVIKSHELRVWYQGLERLIQCKTFDNPEMMKDYFLLILFTGLRRHEAASLKWNDVDLVGKTFTLHDTKNRLSHTLPLTDFLLDLFLRRKEGAINDYVFPAKSRFNHLVEPRKAMLKIIELSGIKHTIHDLRRTFITIAESLDIPVYALKQLLNHKMNNDVTAGYIVTDVERLRKPMQQITDYILKCIGLVSSPVIPIHQQTKQLV